MTEIEVLKRSIKLKRQAIPLIRQEINRDQNPIFLLKLKGEFEARIAEKFDPDLSRKIDAVLVLLGE